jgi:hypothetical protein
VHCELENFGWIKNLQAIHNTEQLEEFILLFMALSPVTLNDQHDSISWKWTSDGNYSVSSAYECQFLGSMSNFSSPALWKTFTEPKVDFLPS